MLGKSISGKTALITGGSRGIGRAIALRLAREGARVVVTATTTADATMQAIQAVGGQGLALPADISTLAGVDLLVTGFREQSGSRAPDILVNNAGIALRANIAQVTETDYERLFAVNVRAPFFIAQHFAADIPRGGRIVNISSRLSQIGMVGQIAYSMSKAAINAFTKCLANELGPRGITVNAIGPGSVETDMTAERFAVPEIRAYLAATTALKRTGKPEDIADVVAFLVSEDARWVTGVYFDVAGGAGL